MSQPNTGVVFPGQGSQKPGMAKDYFDEYSIARDTFAEASAAIGENLETICFEEDPRLDLTEFTQPAILTAEIAAFRVLQSEYGFAPAWFAGHSLGEYSALVAADVIPFTAAVQIVRRRGALMQAAVPQGVGAMAALIMPDMESSGYLELVESAGAEVANYNSSEQVVISGAKEKVEAAAAALAAKFGETMQIVPLPVSAPFHCSLMQGIESDFSAYMGSFAESFKLSNADRVVSNFTSKLHAADTLLDSLTRQISGSVRWIDNMRLMQDRADAIYEVGPNRPLGKFFRTIGVEVTSIINLRSAAKAFAPK